MVEPFVANQITEAATKARLGISRSKNQPVDPAVDERPRAHRAGLQGHKHRTTRESPSTQLFRRLANRQDLGVGQRILLRLSKIVTPPDDSIFENDDRTNRDLTQLRRPLGLRKGKLHPLLILHVENLTSGAGHAAGAYVTG